MLEYTKLLGLEDITINLILLTNEISFWRPVIHFIKSWHGLSGDTFARRPYKDLIEPIALTTVRSIVE